MSLASATGYSVAMMLPPDLERAVQEIATADGRSREDTMVLLLRQAVEARRDEPPAFRLGFRSFRPGKPMGECPLPFEQYLDWSSGWMDANARHLLTEL